MLKLTVLFRSGAPEGMLARLVVRRTDRAEAPFAMDAYVIDQKACFEGSFDTDAEYVYTLASYFAGAAVNFEEHGRIYTGNARPSGCGLPAVRIESGQCIEIRCEIV